MSIRLLVAASVVVVAASAAEIPKGTHMLLQMVNSISTRTAQAGDMVYMRTASPIALSGSIVVPTGSYVTGTVTNSKQSGRMAGRAQLSIHIDTLTLPAGQVVKISPHVTSVDSGESGQKVVSDEGEIRQGSERMKDLGQVAILAGTGASIGGLTDRSWKGAGIGAGVGSAVGLATVLMTRGREVELKQGLTFDVVFDRPVTIE